MKHYEEVLLRVFNRLISIANGRQIVVPLSGGYDSRLIVFMLKLLKYDNIIAFSYGKKDNEESIISNYIAKELGIKWGFVPYSNESWYYWYRNLDVEDYFNFSGNLSSLPHIQDWPAVFILKDIIDKNAIFVPGISADLNTGAFIKKYPKIYSTKADFNNLLDLILEYSYSLFPIKKIKNKHEIINKISAIIDKKPYSKILLGESFECWVSIEKVAKFVMNSVRVYEYWGYEWWTPFWDDEFIEFWCKVPFIFRNNQKLYKEHLIKLSKQLDISNNIDPLFRDGNIHSTLLADRDKISVNKSLMVGLKNIAKNILPEKTKQILRKQRQFFQHLSQFQSHPLQWYGIYHSNYIAWKIISGASNINSIIVLDYLRIIKEKIKSKENK
jgi:asparagine synthase (glutamine-hydrolysing)